MKLEQMTLAVIIQNERILLGLKKRGFGTGKWNGIGGKVEEGETAVECVARELKEEANITALAWHKQGDLIFHNSETSHFRVEVFSVDRFEGEPRESDEVNPKWFPIEQIPYELMFPDDAYWLPLFLAGKSFEGEFNFKEGILISHTLKEVPGWSGAELSF